MTLAAGTRLGPYEILAPLGAGGMGDVYRASDTRLGRIVAVKVLSAQVSADPQLRQRFEREARVISSLNHPNICALYDVGEVTAPEVMPYLVMELVEGESLADRLRRGPMSIEEALPRAIEIADALSSAHRRGVVHRDVKPGNVMITSTGAKLLDFGLAKAGPSLTVATAATTTTPPDITTHGSILGTFHYMAPEQLEGNTVDARTDVFSFGALLFEMITGRKALTGKTQASLIGAILRDQPPPVSSLVAGLPHALDRAIAKCLEKDPDRRWQDASDLRDALKWVGDGRVDVPEPAAVGPARSRSEWLAWSLVVMAMIAVGVLSIPYWRTASLPTVVRFTIAPPNGVTFAPRGAPVAPFPAVSPDGRQLAFIAQRTGDTAPLVWVQSLDSLLARALAETAVRTDTLSPALPFWSPDSRSIGFFADGKMKRVDSAGGSPQTICDAPQSGGGAWGADDTIIFASKIDDGLYQVPATGGAPARLTTPNRAQGEISHSNPAFLPDGRHFLFWVQAPQPAIHIGSIDSTTTARLFESDSRAMYGSGHVFFVRQGTLLAQPFDPRRLATSGDPVTIAEDVRTFALNGRSAFSVSNTGVLVYRSGTAGSERKLVWHDRQGKPVATVPDSAAAYAGMSLAPDDRYVIAEIEGAGASDLWRIDLSTGTRFRITSGGKSEGSPVLSSDGQMLVFASDRHGIDDLFRVRSDGVGAEEVVAQSPMRKYPTHWSLDWISFTAFDAAGKQDLWFVDPRSRRPRPYLQTEHSEHSGRLSPDQRWIVYGSDETGRNAIFLRPFPNADGGKWRISGAASAGAPRWRADGKEIFYADDAGIVAVPVTLPVTPSGSAPELGIPQVLFRIGGIGRAQYEPSRDGTRFLIPIGVSSTAPEPPLTIVLNWPTLLQPR
jgi:eukaryotic-like serine/threonine-protein kinase